MTFVKPYRMGDVVRVKGQGDTEHVIDTVTVRDGEYEYATHLSAWHNHNDLEMVRECDEESIAILIELADDDDEEDEEEEC